MSEKRLFEYKDEKSDKFWEIVQQDCDVTTRWGKSGANGQSKTKSYDSIAEATKDYEKLIREKTTKGYVESVQIAVAGHAHAVAPEPAKLQEQSESDEEDIDDSDTDTADAHLTLQQALESALGGDDFIDRLIADLPDEFKEIAQQELTPEPTGPNPEHLTLEAAEPQTVSANETSAPWLEHLKSQKVKHLGDFVTIEFPVAMQVFLDSKNRLIVISYLGEHSWIDVYVRDQAEIAWTWTNAPTSDGLNPPWSRVFRDPDADIVELLKLAEASGVESAEAKHTTKSFINTFQKSFQLSMMWRNSIVKCDAIRQPPPAEIERSVFQFAQEFYSGGGFHARKPIKSIPSGAALLNASPANAIEILISIFRMQRCAIEIFRYDVLEGLGESLFKRTLPYRATDIDCLAVYIRQMAREDEAGTMLPLFLNAVEQFQKASPLLESTEKRLRQIRKVLVDSYFGSYSTQRARISAILGDDKLRLPMLEGEAWVDAVKADLATMPDPMRAQWTLLFNHCVGATTAKYDAAWKTQALGILKHIGAPAFHEQLFQWLPTLNLPRSTPPNRHGWPPALSIEDANQDILRGIAWCISLLPTDDSPRLLATLAISAYRKIPRVGARAVRVGNACVMALNSIGNQECVGKLALLKIKVKNGTALRYIDSQLQKTADRLNVSRDDLEEMSIPAYGMEEVGLRVEPIGDFVGQATVVGNRIELVWTKGDGKPQKSVPAAVAATHADELKELKADIKDIEKMLAAQKDRLESLYLRNPSWAYATWRERYLDHPLVGIFARRLIWEFSISGTRQLGIYHAGELRDVEDQPLVGIDASNVRLWHPLSDSSELISRWRGWLFDHQVCQPFKQAYREVYPLTPAEVTTGVYSNRFAAHILRQTQYRALAQTRLWNVNYLGAWDGGDEGVAKRTLPAWGLRAEFWVSAAEELEQFEELTHVATDQVRFYRGDEPDPMQLLDVPALVFSEVMRDVDLFVGVASIGNDPNWFDHGTQGRGYQDYWSSYAFGELSASAKTRHEVLQRIVPSLKIAGQCRLADRFLIVEGKLRTYKIHLGSGNTLMEPNDQYLCIVPERKAATNNTTYLPYEGDTLLSIILSKAILLAQDDKIKDPSIVAQLKIN